MIKLNHIFGFSRRFFGTWCCESCEIRLILVRRNRPIYLLLYPFSQIVLGTKQHIYLFDYYKDTLKHSGTRNTPHFGEIDADNSDKMGGIQRTAVQTFVNCKFSPRVSKSEVLVLIGILDKAMSKKLLTLITFVLLCSSIGLAQPEILWEQFTEPIERMQDHLSNIIPLSDGSTLVVGYREDKNIHWSPRIGTVRRIDAEGRLTQLELLNDFNEDSLSFYAHSAIQLSNGNLIISGNASNPIEVMGTFAGYVICLNEDLQVLWRKKLLEVPMHDCTVGKLKLCQDDSFYAFGCISGIGDCFVHVSSGGDSLDSITLSYEQYEYYELSSLLDDNTIIVADCYREDIQLTKIDMNYHVIWSRSIHPDIEYFYPHQLVQLSNGNLAFWGSSLLSPAGILFTTSEGEIVDIREFGGEFAGDHLTDVVLTNLGDYLVTGYHSVQGEKRAAVYCLDEDFNDKWQLRFDDRENNNRTGGAMLDLNDGTFLVGGSYEADRFTSGLWFARVDTDEEGIPSEAHPQPNTLVVNPAYPNPFNSTTTIGYSLPVAGNVSLTVYDLTGREVARLVEDMMPAGTHEAMWGADGVPTGLYFCRIQAGDYVKTTKMTLLK